MVVALARSTARLLRTVGGKSHATAEDHEDAQSAKNAVEVEEDINRPPVSSDEENTVPPYKVPSGVKNVRPPGRSYLTANIHGTSDSKTGSRKGISAPKASGYKRSAASEAKKADNGDGFEDETERTVFGGSQEQRKRTKTYSGSQKSSSKTGKDSSQQKGGFKHAKGQSSVKPKSPEKAPFRKARGIDIDNESQPSSSQAEVPSSGGPSFRRARGFQESSGHDSTEASTLSKIDESPFGRTSRSPSLSSLTSIGSPDVEEVELPKPSDHVAKSPCPLCKEQVEDSFKLDFEIEHCRGKRMNFRMQERFCKAHKTRAASQVWKDRNYPEIDWSSFHKRMKSHHSHLHAVLDGEVKSYYREQLEERLKSGSTKTAMKGINLDANTGSGVGYYGGRGERLMIDHIMRAFSDKIRRVAVSSKLMASMGVSGGVSGYVQTVLVPEMAQALVMEDLRLDPEEARHVIAESSDIGDAINEEEEEKVPRRVIDVSDAEEDE